MVADRSSSSPRLLALVDALALVAFVLVGVRSHHEGSAAAVFVRNAAPLLICWFAVGLVSHTYRRPDLAGWARTWIVAVPVALLIRTAIVGSPTGWRLALFLVVAMAFTLLFLTIGRLAVRGISAMVARRSISVGGRRDQ